MKAYYRSLKPLMLWRQAPPPPDWAGWFGRQAPLVVELGFGNGDRLALEASIHPDQDYVGIELCWPSLKRALRRIHDQGVPNVCLLQEDARTALRACFREQSLDHIYSLFPCPWPKDRHAKHRLFSQDFLRLMSNRLKSGKSARIVTDSQVYCEWIVGQSGDSGFRVECSRIPALLGTRYEQKWSRQGQREFFDIWLHKQEHNVVAELEVTVVQTHILAEFNPDTFQPQELRGKIAIAYKEFFFDAARKQALQRVVITEDGLRQDGWIAISQHHHGGWAVYPAPGSPFVPTVGLQAALDGIRDAAS